MQVAIFGGSFNPPHVAHVLAAAYVLSVHPVDKVLLLPVYSHAFDKELIAFEHRLAMCRLAVAFTDAVEVSDVEQALGIPSRTLRTLEHLEAEHPDWSFRLVVGADLLSEAHKWLSFEEVAKKAPLIVLGRAGTARTDAPPPLLPDISSTRVRSLLKGPAEPTTRAELEASVPRPVLAYIEEHRLYR